MPKDRQPRKRAAVPARVGRPSLRTPEVEEAILDGLVAGRSLRSICEAEGMPHAVTVFRWLADDKDFEAKYAHARGAQADYHAEKSIEIADEATPTAEGIAKARMQIDTRQWYAAKLRPKVYGETKGPAVAVQVNNDNRSVYAELSPPQT